MNRTGRPLHFLGAVLGGWIILRVGVVAAPLLWQTGRPVQIASSKAGSGRAGAPVATNSASSDLALGLGTPEPFRRRDRQSFAIWMAHAPRTGATDTGTARYGFTDPASLATNPSPGTEQTAPPATTVQSPQPASPTPSLPLQPGLASMPSASRWSLTGWLLWRRDAGASLAQAPLLGGSQGGLRLDYRLWGAGSRSLAAYGRVTRALERPFAEEGALGLSLRPIEGVPITLLAERRQRLGTGGRSGFAIFAAGGIGPKPVAPRLEVEGYAQAGFVGLPGKDAFADGKASLDYRLTKGGAPDLALGLGVSGGAQTGASRLDIGPELRLRLPAAGGHLRLSAEWRQRIAGTARPVSGPALALVADF